MGDDPQAEQAERLRRMHSFWLNLRFRRSLSIGMHGDENGSSQERRCLLQLKRGDTFGCSLQPYEQAHFGTDLESEEGGQCKHMLVLGSNLQGAPL